MNGGRHFKKNLLGEKKMLRKKIDYSQNAQKYDGDCPEIAAAVPRDSYVLDIGCSTGKLARDLNGKGCKVEGVDIDRESLKKAARYCAKVYKIDLDNLKDFDIHLRGKKFEAITMGDILEHLKYPSVLLNHIKKYLAPGGIAVATIPNTAFVWTRVRFLLGNFSYSQQGGLMDEDHLRFFSFETARLLFESSGYEIVKIRPSSHGIVNKKYFLVKLLSKLIPTLFAIHVFIVATPKSTTKK